MLIADTLSRAQLEESLSSEEVKALELVDDILKTCVCPLLVWPALNKNPFKIQSVPAFDKLSFKVGLVIFAIVIPLFSRVTKDLC